MAANGAAIYINEACQIQFDSTANITFINNSVILKGGAIYVDLDPDFCTEITPFSSKSHSIDFINNSAGMSGNSVYFSIPEHCFKYTSNISKTLYVPGISDYFDELDTSPNYVALTSQNFGANNYSIEHTKMLGEPIKFTASIYNYLNHTSGDVVLFLVHCETCGEDYVLSNHHVSVSDKYLQEIKILSNNNKDIAGNIMLNIKFLAVLSSMYKNIDFKLLISLSPCRSGYLFNALQCECYPNTVVRE